MSNINRVLLFLLVVLMSIISYELYFFYVLRGTPQKTNTAPVNVSQLSQDISGTAADFFKEGAAGTLSGFTMTVTYTGTLSNLDATKRKITGYRTKQTFDVGLTIDMVTENGKKKEFYLMTGELPKLAYYTASAGGVLRNAQPGDFKPGDPISFTETLNLMASPADNLLEGKIVKRAK